MNIYKAEGIVLHTIKHGERALVAYVLTDIAGRETYLIRGIGSVRSKEGRWGRASFFQPMFPIEFNGFVPPKSNMHSMREVRLSSPLRCIPFDVRKSTIALFMAEIIYKLVKEEEQNLPLFEFVKKSVFALDQMEDGVANFHLWFLVGLSRYLGFYPSNEYVEGDYFDIVNGCFKRGVPLHRFVINEENSRLLYELMDCEVSDLGNIKLSRRQRNDFIESLLSYFGYYLDTMNSIQSIKILTEVF